MTFADCMKRAGLTEETLSEAANVDVQIIKGIMAEASKYLLIPVTDGIRIAHALDTTVAELITDMDIDWD